MSWAGILIGGALGSLGGPIGALIGAAIGHLVTSSTAAGTEAEAENESEFTEGADRQALFVVALFSTLAKLAKADGVVSTGEAELVKAFISEHFKPEQRPLIREIFNTARDNDEPYQAYLDQLNAIVGDDREFKQHFLGVLCELSMADGVLHPNEREILIYAERLFGLPGYVDTFFSYGQAARKRTTASLNVYYEILGCSPTVTDAELKSAYRNKCRDFHPDKIQARGLPEEFVSFAEKEMQRINEAYETITRVRAESGKH